MTKHHHMAHHLKNFRVDVPVYFADDDPARRPYICWEKSREVFYILCFVDNGTGMKRLKIWRDDDGEFFKKKETAEEYIKVKWPS